MAHQWVHSAPYSPLPPYAVIGGHDCDRSPIYVGRSFHEGDNLPAKVIPSKNTAYVCWGGREIVKTHYEVLTGQNYNWIPCAAGSVPPNAVLAGNTVTGEPLYIGRGHWEGSLTVGKIHPSHHCLYIPFGGQERRLDTYEVLTYERPHGWVPGQLNYVPPSTVVAGHDTDGSTIYVGRALHEGENLPAKVIPNKSCAYVCFGGYEIFKNNFEALTGQGYYWVKAQHGAVPPGAVSTGRTRNGEPVFVGRGHHHGSLTPGHNWVSSSAYAAVPPLAVVGGHDSDGATIYVGRSYHEGDGLAAKVIPSKHTAYVSWRGQEIQKSHFDILCGNYYTWRPCYDHVIPHNAVECGRTQSGQRIFVGRGHFEGSLTVGKVMTVHRALFIPYGGIERRIESYEVLVREGPQTTWVSCTGSSVPPNAVHAGNDTDMATIYVGRAYHEGDLIPAKVIPNKSCAYISHGGNEIVKSNFEVLTGYGFRWVSAAEGYVPPGAVEAGRTVQGEQLYVGRAHYCGSLTPGKVQRSHGCLYIPFAGRERRVASYEVLVRDDQLAVGYPPQPPPYTPYDDDKNHHHHHHHHHSPPPPPPPYNPGFGIGLGFKVKF